jgi:hypothetical protein
MKNLIQKKKKMKDLYVILYVLYYYKVVKNKYKYNY